MKCVITKSLYVEFGIHEMQVVATMSELLRVLGLE